MPVSTRLTIPNADGHRLAARLETPDAGAPIAYALVAHCFTCSKDLRAVRQISAALAAQGMGVLSVDFTGLGQSEGDFQHTSFSSTVGDLLAAAAHLTDTHAAPQLLVGHSLGGAAVLAAAAHLPSVRAIATVGAPCDPGHVRHLLADAEADIEAEGSARVDIGGRPFTIRKQFLDDLDSHAAMRARIAALDRALLVFHSPQDQTVGIDQARHIYDAARHPKSFVSLDGADHLLSDPADARYVADVLAAWAERYLCPSEPEPVRDYDDATVTATIGASGFRTVLAARGFTVVADEPARVGGTETGPTPYDLLGMALGACTSMTLRMYADRKGLALDGVVTEVSHAKIHADDCAHCATVEGHLDRLTRTIRLDGDLTDDERARLLEIADRCPVHRTLEGEVDVVTVPSPSADPDVGPLA
ncbi:alpha/beta fold hydrolase [Rubrivirga sp. IMCC45206]|uniref:bifunctional alpha/beta hydrolase/OsmC family protein n=1 Tax=Rubrivirga sp. IMCC45206 TaxID=3391614 RepID=UPI0039903548